VDGGARRRTLGEIAFLVANVLLHASLLAFVLVTPWTFCPLVVPKFVWFRGTTLLAVAFFLLGLATSPAPRAQDTLRRVRATVTSPLGLAVTAFALAVQLACLLGEDPSRSFWSNLDRGEGAAQLLILYCYFLLLAALFDRPREWLFFFKSICVAGLLSVVYGLLEAFNVLGLFEIRPLDQPGFRFEGANGSAESFAAVALFAIFFSLFVVSAGPPRRLRSPGNAIWLGSSLVFVAALLWSGTRGALLGLAAGGLTFAIALAISQPRWRRPLVAAGAAGAALALLAAVQRHTTARLLPYSLARLFDLSLSTGTFADRRTIWRMVWNGFLDRPLLGLGPENVTLAIYRHFDPSYYRPPQAYSGTPDRAHNLLFDDLATIGVIGTVAFLSIFVVFYLRAAKRIVPEGLADRPIARALLLAMPVAYLVQNLVFFDTLTTYICLFTFLAFAQQLHSPAPAGAAGDGATKDGPSRERPLRIGLAVVGIPLSLSLLVMGAVLPYLKAKRIRDAMESPYRNKSLPEILDDVDQAVGLYSPSGDEDTTVALVRNLGTMMDEDRNLPPEVVHELLGHIEPTAGPGVEQWCALGMVYSRLTFRASRADDYARAVAYFSKARERAPWLPTVLYPLLDVYRGRGDRQGIAELGEAILSRWPDDARVRHIVHGGPPPSASR
jgi:O-antigen ligase